MANEKEQEVNERKATGISAKQLKYLLDMIQRMSSYEASALITILTESFNNIEPDESQASNKNGGDDNE